MRVVLTLAACSLVSALTPGMPVHYVVIPTSVPSETAIRPCPPSLSLDGASVAFEAHVSLDPADQNGKPDVYLLERSTNRVVLLSRNPDGRAGRGSSRCPRVSGDGRRVVFESDATDLVEGDPPVTTDVFVLDRRTNALRRIAPITSAGPNTSARPALSADGRVMVFDSRPVDATPDQRSHVYRVSLDGPPDVQEVGEGYGATVSTDGSVVAFVTSLHAGAPQVIRVIGPDVARTVGPSAGQMTEADVFAPALSGDGQWIAYVLRPRSAHRGSADVARAQVYVEHVGDGLRHLVSVTAHAREANGISKLPAIDATGSRVVFESTATNLACDWRDLPSCRDDINLLGDVFLWERTTGSVMRVNVVASELPWLEGAAYPTVSPDGRHVAFLSRQPVSGADGRDTFDLFITRQ